MHQSARVAFLMAAPWRLPLERGEPAQPPRHRRQWRIPGSCRGTRKPLSAPRAGRARRRSGERWRSIQLACLRCACSRSTCRRLRTPAPLSAACDRRSCQRLSTAPACARSQLSPRPLAVAQVLDDVSLPVLEKITKHPHRRFRITLERRDERRANLVRVTLDVLEEITVVLVLGVHDCAGFFFEEAVDPHVEYHLPILCALVRELARGKCAIPCGVEVCEVAHACLPAYWSRSDA